MAGLTILSGMHGGRHIRLERDSLVLGRHADCDLVLEDDTVSRRHARIVRTLTGFALEDLDSRNGTYVNGRRVTARLPLRDGDQIQLFDIALTFHDAEGSDRDTVERPAFRRAAAPHARDDERAIVRAQSETVAEVDLADIGRLWGHVNAEIKLQAVLDVIRGLHSWLEPDQLTAQILDSLFRIFPQLARACVLRVRGDGRRLEFAAVKLREDEDGPPTIGPVLQSVVRRALADGKALLSVDVVTGRPSEAAASVHELEHRSVMCAPLLDSASRPLGALYIDSTDEQRQFRPPDLDVLVCVAILASQALEQAHLHNSRYRAVVDTCLDGIITFAEDGAIESVNPAADSLFGHAAGGLPGRNILDLVPGLSSDDGHPLAEGGRRLAWTTGRRGEALARRRDGSTFPIHIAVGDFELAGRRRFTATVHDITEHKRAENALKTLNEELERQVQQRTESIRLLQDVAVIANEADSVEQAFRAALDRICRLTGWPVGHVVLRSSANPAEFVDTAIWTLAPGAPNGTLPERAVPARRQTDGPGLVARVIAGAEPQWTDDVSTDAAWPNAGVLAEAGLRAGFAFPVLMGGDVVGAVEFFAPRAGPPDRTVLEAMKHVGTQLGRVVERRLLQQELIDAVWNQQRQFGQELHDTLGQELTGIGMVADGAARALAQRSDDQADTLRELTAMIQQAKQGARRLAKGLFPVEVDARGLAAALDELGASTRQRCGLEVEVRAARDLHVGDNLVATHLFRIAQEAVTNAVKHAQAGKLQIMLARNLAGALVLRVADDGVGVKPNGRARTGGMGLRIMRYRAHAMGAELRIEPVHPRGTVVTCTLPRNHEP